jgi:signal peptidase I
MKKGCKIAITIVGVALVVVLLRGCVATSYLIPSSGMENSLYQGERILVNKWSYGLRLPFMKLWELGSSFLNGFEINVSITRGQVDKATSALRYIIYFISAPL